jgi:hypothetical protein
LLHTSPTLRVKGCGEQVQHSTSGYASAAAVVSRHPTTIACHRAQHCQGQAFGGREEAASLDSISTRRLVMSAVGTEEKPPAGSNKRKDTTDPGFLHNQSQPQQKQVIITSDSHLLLLN